MREELPDLRASMTRLNVVAQSRNLESTTVTNWLDSVADEMMPELRQALEDQAT